MIAMTHAYHVALGWGIALVVLAGYSAPHGAPRPLAGRAGAAGAAPVELTPRTAPDPSDLPTAPRRRSLWAYGILAVVLVAVGVVAYQGLTSASLYFYNADEAVERAGRPRRQAHPRAGHRPGRRRHRPPTA